MAKKKSGRARRVCIIGDCGNYARGRGWKVCKGHSSVNALQQEIERLRASHPEGAWWPLRHAELRRMFRLVTALDAGADSSSSNGRLGAALAQVAEAADRVEEIAGSRPPKDKPVAHCGREECPKPDRAQRADAVYCGYCGHLMPGMESHERS